MDEITAYDIVRIGIKGTFNKVHEGSMSTDDHRRYLDFEALMLAMWMDLWQGTDSPSPGNDAEALRAAGAELYQIVAALEDATSENRMDAFALSAAAALPGIKAALRRWREVTGSNNKGATQLE